MKEEIAFPKQSMVHSDTTHDPLYVEISRENSVYKSTRRPTSETFKLDHRFGRADVGV